MRCFMQSWLIFFIQQLQCRFNFKLFYFFFKAFILRLTVLSSSAFINVCFVWSYCGQFIAMKLLQCCGLFWPGIIKISTFTHLDLQIIIVRLKMKRLKHLCSVTIRKWRQNSYSVNMWHGFLICLDWAQLTIQANHACCSGTNISLSHAQQSTISWQSVPWEQMLSGFTPPKKKNCLTEVLQANYKHTSMKCSN